MNIADRDSMIAEMNSCEHSVFFEDLNIFKHHETTVAIEFIHHFFGASKSCERHSALEDFQQDMCVSPWDVRQIVSMLEIGAWRPAIFWERNTPWDNKIDKGKTWGPISKICHLGGA